MCFNVKKKQLNLHGFISGRLYFCTCKYMKRKIFYFLVLCFVAISCSNGGSEKEVKSDVDSDSVKVAEEEDTLELFDEVKVPKSADELFNDFFYNFTSDESFQMSRIKFPLVCKDGDAKLKISRSDWKNFNRFTTQDYYSALYERENEIGLQKDTSLSHVSVEWIYLHDSYIEKYNFRRIKGVWILKDIEKSDFYHNPNGSFLRFYADFSCDSIPYEKSLAHPLKLLISSEDDESQREEETLSYDGWRDFKKDMPLPKDYLININYGQSYFSENRKILLIEGVSNSLFVKYTFDRSNGQWRLFSIEI